jgi:hypothetical protein
MVGVDATVGCWPTTYKEKVLKRIETRENKKKWGKNKKCRGKIAK